MVFRMPRPAHFSGVHRLELSVSDLCHAVIVVVIVILPGNRPGWNLTRCGEGK